MFPFESKNEAFSLIVKIENGIQFHGKDRRGRSEGEQMKGNLSSKYTTLLSVVQVFSRIYKLYLRNSKKNVIFKLSG